MLCKVPSAVRKYSQTQIVPVQGKGNRINLGRGEWGELYHGQVKTEGIVWKLIDRWDKCYEEIVYHTGRHLSVFCRRHERTCPRVSLTFVFWHCLCNKWGRKKKHVYCYQNSMILDHSNIMAELFPWTFSHDRVLTSMFTCVELRRNICGVACLDMLCQCWVGNVVSML